METSFPKISLTIIKGKGGWYNQRMKENKFTIRISRPVSEVFEFTVNPDNTHKWIDFIEKEWIDTDQPEIGTIYTNKSTGGEESAYTLDELQTDKIFNLPARMAYFMSATTIGILGRSLQG